MKLSGIFENSLLSNIPKLMFVYRDLNPKIFSNGAFLYPRYKCAILLNPEFWISWTKTLKKVITDIRAFCFGFTSKVFDRP